MSDEIVSGNPKGTNSSPRWSSTTKMVVALSLIAIMAGLVIRFRQIVAPLFIAFLLAYVLYPVASFLNRRIKISWRLASGIILLLLLIILIGLLTLGGLAIFNQIQSLINFLQEQITNIPGFVNDLTSKPIVFGPFVVDLTTLDATNLANQLLGLIQPFLSNTATILGNIATGAATTVGWIFFTILVAYFILSDSGGARSRLINLKIPGYSEDMARLGHELGNIWRAFARGQMILLVITVIVYVVILGGLGVNFYFGLALLAGLARFVPYVGPWVAWITYGLVTFFQETNYFGLQPIGYVILVVGIAIVIDVVMDNVVVPRMMGDTLKVHPAAVMVAAIVFASLFGILGVLLAAPVMATVTLVLTYVIRKLFDIDPWLGFETRKVKPLPPVFRSMGAFFVRFGQWSKAKYDGKWPQGIPFFRTTGKFFARLWQRIARKPETPPTTISGGKDEQLDGTQN